MGCGLDIEVHKTRGRSLKKCTVVEDPVALLIQTSSAPGSRNRLKNKY